MERFVHLVDARELAFGLLREHGLVGWRFSFDHARRRFGSCRVRSKLITLSRPLTLLNERAQVRDTLLHEIAHALTPGQGHGGAWKKKCIAIGAIPSRCYTTQDVRSPPRSPPKLALHCARCQWLTPRRRRPSRRLICKQCRGDVQVLEMGNAWLYQMSDGD